MEDEKQFHRRSGILMGLFALCLACFVLILYDAQVVNRDEYLSQSTTQVTTTQTVKTFRGVITDRNGKTLVSNQERYTITFDTDLVPAEEGVDQDTTVSRAVLRLIRLCQEQGVSWTDNLPLSAQPPFSYTTSSASATQLSRFQRFLAKQKWSDSELTSDSPYPAMSDSLREKLQAEDSQLSASTLLSLLREHFGVDPDFTDQEARLVVGVLYELSLRTLDANYYVPPYVFAEDVSVELISILNDGNFGGVVIDSESVRQYHTDYAAHILGRTGAIYSSEELAALNAPYSAALEAGEDVSSLHRYSADDTVGKDGAEQAFESYLRGKDGKRIITTNESGKITSELYSVDPEPGGTVALTIDIDFQAAVEDILAQAVEDMNAEDGLETRGAGAVVVSVADSGILALASYPNYSQRTYVEDLEALSQDPGMPFFNRATSGTYVPGSTFKPITAVAALETGIITPTTKINATGHWTYPNYPASYANCWLYNSTGGRHGRINVSEAITVSCNYFFAQLGYELGLTTLNEYVSAFGLGQPTGIEIGENTGLLAEGQLGQDLAPWAAFGQADQLYTPLQLANYIATLVRGGQRYSAHLLESVTSYDGSETLYANQPQVMDTVEISESTLAAVKKGMGDLVTSGTISSYFKDCVVTAGAKTGSAQTGEEVANGVFVCFAPFDEPEIAVAIVIEQGHSGAALASTAVNILNAYFSPSDIGTALVPEGVLLP